MAAPTNTDRNAARSTAALRPRVGQRIFGSLAIAAIIPAVLAMALAYHAVSRQLEDAAYDRLHVEAQNHGLGIYTRLQLARGLIRRAGSANGQREPYFLTVRQAQGSQPPFSVRPAPGSDTGVAGVWLADSDATGQNVVAELAPAFLYGSPDYFPYGISFCVIAAAGDIVSCPADLAPETMATWKDALADNGSGRFRTSVSGSDRIAAFFSVPLHDEFGHAGFTVAAVQDRDAALLPADGFRQATLPVIGIAALMTLWFGFRIVNGRLRLLERLTEGASRMADGDLTTPVDVDSDDEFGTIGRAFEHARRELASQFDTMNALSELDRAILKDTDIESVYRIALRYIVDVFDCANAHVLVHHPKREKETLLMGCQRGGTPQRLDSAPASDLANIGLMRLTSIGLDEAGRVFGPGLNRGSATRFELGRVNSPGALETVICLGFDSDRSAETLSRRSLSDFLDRLAVAQQAFERSKRLYRQAHYDLLTGLPNRQLFLDRLERLVALAEHSHQGAALLFIDLDDFKSVNDSQGHPVGDVLLRRTARRIRRLISRRDTAARLGGDEFGVILADVSSPNDVMEVADRLVHALSQPFDLEGIEHFLGASIGIALAPADGADADTLVRNADTAMYKAKADGKGRTAFFEPSLNERVSEHVRLNADLRHALENDEFELYYQPKLDLTSDRIESAEALIRWHHPERGFVPPDRFIALAERSNLIVGIGEWVARTAIRQQAAWRREGLLDSIAINVSYRQLHDSDLEKQMVRCVEEFGVDPQSIELEITESIAATDMERVATVLGKLRSRGFRVAIDDFGTGYSSFGYLTDMEFDTIKMDRIFLNDFPDNPRKHAVVAGILQLARQLGKHTVAEGVEDPRQIQALEALGCDTVQGYAISAPVDAVSFETLVREQAAGNERRRAG